MNGYEEVEVGVPPMPHQYYYDRNTDMVEQYGSIIKDLTDTEQFLYQYELRLCGLKIDDNGREVPDDKLKTLIKNRQTAKDFVEMIRSIANQNTHFTGFKERDINNALNSLNYTMNRWLMFQGETIPLRYREKLSMEAMNIAKASLHKALGALMAKWSKGQIQEGQQIVQKPQEKGGLFGFFGKKQR